jgi:U32 family peptidase
MILKSSKLELISPAGSLEKMRTALAFGADAVYLGLPQFSLRARINKFEIKDVEQAVLEAHEQGKKVYLTFNIFAHNHHLKDAAKYLGQIKKFEADGIIISDFGILELVRKILPQAKIHLSTQANCLNYKAVEFWQKQGVSRVILGREASLDDIKLIHRKVPSMELEYFVHGAMCMAYSGRCFLSKYLRDRSANLGDCIQPCRWKQKKITNYELRITNSEEIETVILPEESDKELRLIEDGDGSYILNSKDLCLIEHLEELIRAGVTSFKIEGRTKSAFYVALTAGAYRLALDLGLDRKIDIRNKKSKLKYLHNQLNEKLYHRGFTTGFIFEHGGQEQELERSHIRSSWEFCGQAIPNSKFQIPNSKFLTDFIVHNSIKAGDKVEIIRPDYDIIKMQIKRMSDVETGAQISEAHGGQAKIIRLATADFIPSYSVMARKLKV